MTQKLKVLCYINVCDVFLVVYEHLLHAANVVFISPQDVFLIECINLKLETGRVYHCMLFLNVRVLWLGDSDGSDDEDEDETDVQGFMFSALK